MNTKLILSKESERLSAFRGVQDLEYAVNKMQEAQTGYLDDKKSSESLFIQYTLLF